MKKFEKLNNDDEIARQMEFIFDFKEHSNSHFQECDLFAASKGKVLLFPTSKVQTSESVLLQRILARAKGFVD